MNEVSIDLRLSAAELAALDAMFEGWLRQRVTALGPEAIRNLETDFILAKDYPGYIAALLRALRVEP